jgi:potassium inwardly-rectifying channel subfamily J
MGGIMFVKLSRPKKRTETLMFSKQAVVALRDGIYCLMCRVGDMRKSHILQANVRMYLIRTRYTAEGEVIPWNAQELELGKSTNNLLFMPIVVEHLINESSPLRDLIVKKTEKVKDEKMQEVPIGFKQETFEIIVILEGVVETTGATIQARTSYTSAEIQWNHIFEPLVNCNLKKATIDYSKFNRTIDLQTNSIDKFHLVNGTNEKKEDAYKNSINLNQDTRRAYDIV